MKKPHDQLSRIRFLTLSLFLSGSFNILLLALLCYWATQDKTVGSFAPIIPTNEIANTSIIKSSKVLEKEQPQNKAVQIISKKTIKLPLTKTYVVQEGDSLWKIARKFQIDMEKLKQANALSSDMLKPGTVLLIPI